MSLVLDFHFVAILVQFLGLNLLAICYEPHGDVDYHINLTTHSHHPSGHLVLDFLLGDSTPLSYVSDVMDRGHEYNGFNLITATLG